MRTKLLKKVRKRFEINYFPKGIQFHNDFYEGEFLVRIDNDKQYGFKILKITSEKLLNWDTCVSLDEGLTTLKGSIIKKLRLEMNRPPKNKIVTKKLWYNKAK